MIKRLLCKLLPLNTRGKVKHDYCGKCNCNYHGICVKHIVVR